MLFGACGQQQEEEISKKPVKKERVKLFELLSPESTGVTFANTIQDNERINILTYEYFYNGGGVAVGDINNDGLPDLYFTANQLPNKLYLNKGNLRFEDITDKAGAAGQPGWSTGVTMADVNSDGYLDIYLSKSGKYPEVNRRNELLINNGNLTFTEQAGAFGIDDPGYSSQALFLDYDGDNDLDMFLLNHSVRLFLGQDGLALSKQIDPFAGDKFYRNDGGKFTDISAQVGINRNPLGYGLGVAAGDLNNDGWVDIYVTNDYVEPDYMYINNGDGTFTNQIKKATKHISNFGMGVDIADINNDGWQDVYVADMVAEDNYRQKTMMRAMNPDEFYQAVEYGFHHQYMFNSLQLNNQNMTFSEIAQMGGVSNTDWSWATLLSDFNNDGWRDLFISNGFRKEFSNKDYVKYREKVTRQANQGDLQVQLAAMRELINKLPETKIPNYIFENNQDLTFSKKTYEWGLTEPSHSNGATVADLDNDGDLELIINNVDAPAFIYKNKTSEELQQHYLKVKFDGPKGNQSGLGARINISSEGKKLAGQHFLTRGFQSSSEDVMHFGLGEVSNISKLEVIWPDGKFQALSNVKVDQILELSYDNAKGQFQHKESNTQRYFEDVTEVSGIDYLHRENDYHDFVAEVLLPHKMSQFGPGVAVGDVNGDQLDDFYVGGAKDFSGALFTQNADGTFERSNSNPWVKDAKSEDLDATFFDADTDGDLDLYVVSGGNEYVFGSFTLKDRLYINDGQGNFETRMDLLPSVNTSGSVVKPYDFDNDGDLDLFVGGRVFPQQYPKPVKSFLLQNEGGSFKDVTGQYAKDFEALALVTDAQWGDFNGNNKPDLVIVGEWTAVMIYEFDGDKFVDITEASGLSAYTGWWYSIASSDVDADGDLDLIAGNLGLNYKYKASPEEPFHVYYNDFDGNGRGDIVLSYFDKGELYPLRGRQCSSEQIPALAEKFPTYHEFASANLEQVYGAEKLAEAIHYKATTFASTLFINNGGSFEPRELPTLAQISSINASVAEDFDGDGLIDIAVAGNLYPVEVETTRNDASYGLLLKGNGQGNFTSVPATESGFFVDGDVKFMKTIKLADGGRGILVSKNSDYLQLIRVDNNRQVVANN